MYTDIFNQMHTYLSIQFNDEQRQPVYDFIPIDHVLFDAKIE